MEHSLTSIVFDTKILKVNPNHIKFAPDAHITGELPIIEDQETLKNLQEAVSYLTDTEYNVAFPTETVYGLGGSSLSDASILNIYKAKNRPSDNPLITHISSLDQLSRVIYHDKKPGITNGVAKPHQWSCIPAQYHKLVASLWPGPLTILLPVPEHLPHSDNLSKLTFAGQPTFAVRLPSHPVARALIAMSDLPIAAPSANTSTKPSPTTAKHVFQDLQGKIPVILDGGDCSVGVESSVIDCVTSPRELILLRPGGFTLEEISKMSDVPLDSIKVECVLQNKDNNVRTPGMKYKHYSPSCKVYLFVPVERNGASNAEETTQKEIMQQVSTICNASDTPVGKIAILTSFKFDEQLLRKADPKLCGEKTVIFQNLGSTGLEIQRNIFKHLRDLDESDHVDAIFIEGVPERDEGLAIMNRLNKSSGGNTIPFYV